MLGDEDAVEEGGLERDNDLIFSPLRLKLRRCFPKESANEDRRDLMRRRVTFQFEHQYSDFNWLQRRQNRSGLL